MKHILIKLCMKSLKKKLIAESLKDEKGCAYYTTVDKKSYTIGKLYESIGELERRLEDYENLY